MVRARITTAAATTATEIQKMGAGRTRCMMVVLVLRAGNPGGSPFLPSIRATSEIGSRFGLPVCMSCHTDRRNRGAPPEPLETNAGSGVATGDGRDRDARRARAADRGGVGAARSSLDGASSCAGPRSSWLRRFAPGRHGGPVLRGHGKRWLASEKGGGVGEAGTLDPVEPDSTAASSSRPSLIKASARLAYAYTTSGPWIRARHTQTGSPTLPPSGPARGFPPWSAPAHPAHPRPAAPRPGRRCRLTARTPGSPARPTAADRTPPPRVPSALPGRSARDRPG